MLCMNIRNIFMKQINIFEVKEILFHFYELKKINISFIEIIITISGILCIWLASKEKSINYLFGIINVSLCGYIFYQNQLYASLILQIFFFITNIYGWYNWKNNNTNKNKIKIKYLSYRLMFICIIISIILILIFYIYINEIFYFLTKISIFVIKFFGIEIVFKNITPNIFPFWDSCILVLSIFAMILMTHKYIENWLIWIVINFISFNIFIYKGMYILSIEYILLTYLSLNGYLLWSIKKNYFK